MVPSPPNAMTSSQSAGRMLSSALVPRSTTSTQMSRAQASMRSSSGSHSPDGFASTPMRLLPLAKRNLLRLHAGALPESKRIRLGAGLEEGDLQCPLANLSVLAHELVHAGVLKQAVSVF